MKLGLRGSLPILFLDLGCIYQGAHLSITNKAMLLLCMAYYICLFFLPREYFLKITNRTRLGTIYGFHKQMTE